MNTRKCVKFLLFQSHYARTYEFSPYHNQQIEIEVLFNFRRFLIAYDQLVESLTVLWKKELCWCIYLLLFFFMFILHFHSLFVFILCISSRGLIADVIMPRPPYQKWTNRVPVRKRVTRKVIIIITEINFLHLLISLRSLSVSRRNLPPKNEKATMKTYFWTCRLIIELPTPFGTSRRNSALRHDNGGKMFSKPLSCVLY